MRIQTRIAVAAVLMGAASLAQAVSITIGGCAPAASDPSGLTTCVAGATVINFNGTAVGSLPANYSSSGGAGGQVVSGSMGGQYAAPGLIDTTNYLTTPSPGTNSVGSVTATANGSYNYFGLYWGSMDNYNSITFLSGGAAVASYTGADVITAANLLGNQTSTGSNRYVNFWFGGQSFDSVVFASTNFAFESDNHAYANVPEPATLGLLGLGLAGIGLARRRKTR